MLRDSAIDAGLLELDADVAAAQFRVQTAFGIDGSQPGVFLSIWGEEMASIRRYDMHGSWQWDAHTHEEHQLLWAPNGAVTLQIAAVDWLIPPTMALWIPAGVVHGVAGSRAGLVHCVYFAPDRYEASWTAVTALTVEPLARELLLYLDDVSVSPLLRSRAETILLDVLKPALSAALHIPIPRDPRARLVAEAVIADPADARDLADWAWRAHTSERTLRRLFAEETAMAFTQWRLHVRMRAAMKHLAEGESVGVTARKVGYGTSASFVKAFGRVTGSTPTSLRSHG